MNFANEFIIVLITSPSSLDSYLSKVSQSLEAIPVEEVADALQKTRTLQRSLMWLCLQALF